MQNAVSYVIHRNFQESLHEKKITQNEVKNALFMVNYTNI